MQLLPSAGPRRTQLPLVFTITAANNDINQVDHVSHHYSQLSRKQHIPPPLIHHLPESKELSRREKNKTVFVWFFFEYLLCTWQLAKPFLQL